MSYHNKSIKQVLADEGTNATQGLDSNEVKKRIDKYGENKLEEKDGKTLKDMIIDQFKDVLIIILIVAAIISIVLGEIIDGTFIIAIVILNAVLGVVQENKASNALKALKEMAAPAAKVIRNSKLEKIASSELVPGDVVILEAGDYVPADIRLIESVNLKIEEAALTGESVPVEKEADALVDTDAPLGDRENMAFMSTIVTYGRGKGVVTSTGMKTEIGNIANMLNEVEEVATPLQKKLTQFGKVLGVVCLAVCAIIFVLGILRDEPLLEIFMTSVSLAVAAIPEGLPAVVTVVLALGMQRMVKRDAIVKKLAAVETLGSTTVICTDKTGTLTQNKMVVTKLFDGNHIWDVSGVGYSTVGQIVCEKGECTSDSLERIMQVSVLCNDAKIVKEKEDIIGDPTEGALVVLGAKGGYPQEELNKSYPRIDEFPFDSERKLMSTIHQRKDDRVMYTKGAPDVILSRCTKININGEIQTLTEEHINRIKEINDQFANNALRVLGFAYKVVTEGVDITQEEKDLVFLGLTGMMDPPREEAREAVKLCKRAGIRVVMITGDHKTTASAIAKDLGIIDGQSEAMSGSEINGYSDEEFKEKVKHVSVFARVSPEHKVKIVKAIKSNGDIAAMTGDGVNDAPALKQADIGVAMGITGTDVAKEAADMVLTDDNFASIVDAVEEGRVIFSNIRKFVGFLLSCNFGELLLIFVAMLINWGSPLVAIQILWINLVTDSFPAFALGLEAKEDGIMDEKPRDPNAPITDRDMLIAIGFQSVALAVAGLASFWLGSQHGGVVAGQTYCFITVIIGELLRAYSARSEEKFLIKMKVFGNKYLNYSVLLALVLLFVVVYVPFLQPIFSTTFVPLADLGIIIAMALIPLAAGELSKILKKAN
ncbi:calcium-translocating P-type ATPase, PMCA-type [Vallitalea okinawensis]|uniref:calcium-translocating P-type ATPase, PMCA-type n=1 Tax=Vallitalea okinawensis TaxID=2078660 RepID=UPI000CFD5BA3|nr:calcium-translocating P-type ATPase, PMCA-type [Vallitalea okinawensis]